MDERGDLTQLREELQFVDTGPSLALAESLQAGARRRTFEGFDAPEVAVHMEDSAALLVGHLLEDLDRELRRSAGFLSTDYAVGPPVRPIPGAALQVLSASPGTLDFLALALSPVAHVLLSQPVQLAITL